jgi:hypothetical protein
MIYEKNYDDIINLPHHVSKIHKKMSISDRAAQFAPFAALKGHDDAINETSRFVNEKLILDESNKLIINEKLQYLKQNIKQKPLIHLTYFKEDDKKIGGESLSVKAKIIKIDEYEKVIILENNIKILFENIIEIECE